MIASSEIAKKYISFFTSKGHSQIPNAPLVLQNDPTTLFTSSGMQPLVPYLLGEPHPQGNRLVNVQNCIRTQDIEEVGDNRHTTFFRMLGNWSLGDYFKTEEIPWLWEFLTKELMLPKEKLYITVFNGIDQIPKDEDAVAQWTEILLKENLHPSGRIYYYSDKSNWWSRAGVPGNMPAGEPGGPSSEVFFEFSDVPHNPAYGESCHPNCDCGRFIEIGNSVFMQYKKNADGSFSPLPKNNIDFGGGLERLAAATHNNPDVFQTDLYMPIITAVSKTTQKSYNANWQAMRIIADHLKAASFLIADGVVPANKEHGYILRRLLRRSAVKLYQLNGNNLGPSEIASVITILEAVFAAENSMENTLSTTEKRELVSITVAAEMEKFAKTLARGMKEVEKYIEIIDDKAFDLFQSYGFPFEILAEIVAEKGKTVNKERFQKALDTHKNQSRTASAGKFKGGLADHTDKTIKGHTATHLLQKALRDILGTHVFQTGSNITSERIRFDFSHTDRLTDEQLMRIEQTVNEKIKENLPVHFEMLPTEKGKAIGAIGLFEDTYAEVSKIYFIGDTSKSYNDAYSAEFCGGPHVDFTGKLKSFKIIKQENLGKQQKRLYAVVE